MVRRVSNNQPDLLSWTPPAPVERFEDSAVRAPQAADRLCRAISVALADCDADRPEVARRMSEYLGQKISVNMLNAYASQAREGHVISATRLIALIFATRDRRLLELIAEEFGWCVIDRRFLPLIEMAAIAEHQDQLAARREQLRREARGAGILG